MKTITQKVRTTGLCFVAITAISMPTTSQAGWFSSAKNRVQHVTHAVTQTVSQKVHSTTDKFMENSKLKELTELVSNFHAIQQLRDTVGMVKEMQADYNYFSGGSGCDGECANFRSDLKDMLGEYTALANAVPAMRNDQMLINTLNRATNLVDKIPPHALYPLWQIMANKLGLLRDGANNIRQDLAALPELLGRSALSVSNRSVNTSGGGQFSTASADQSGGEYQDGPFCRWVDDKPFVDLIQARLEQVAWFLRSTSELIPDAEVKGFVGAEGGAAVANVDADAGVGVKPTDASKIILKAVAMVPEQINWMIKINTLRAATVCQVVQYSHQASN